jgi:hypothetical protein
MPRVGLEPTIPAFERAKTIRASDRAATVIGISYREGPELKSRHGNRIPLQDFAFLLGLSIYMAYLKLGHNRFLPYPFPWDFSLAIP